MNELTVVLSKERSCKHSVVFKPTHGSRNDVVQGIYLLNPAYDNLGRPDNLELQLRRTDA